MENLQQLENNIEDLRRVILGLNKFMLDSFKKVDSNFEAVQETINTIEVKIDALSKQSKNEFQNVDGKLKDLKNEVIKIQKVSNYTEEYENLLKISK